MPVLGSPSAVRTHAQPDNLSPPPTRFYFHAANSTVTGTLPSTEQSSLTSVKDVDAQTVNRSMDTTIGTTVATLSLTSNGTTSAQNYYFSKFISPPINQTSVAANTWTYAFATRESGATANFPVSGSGQVVWINVYVWRPSTGAKVGTILDGNTAPNVREGTANQQMYRLVNFVGSSVSSVQNGDVIVCEIWFQVTQGSTSVLTDEWFYDGGTVYGNENTTASDAASFLETPEVITFASTLTRVTNTLTLIYNIRKQVTSTKTLKYNIRQRISSTKTLKYNIRKRITDTKTLKYNIRQRITATKTLKYNIRQRITQTRTLKYNIRQRITATKTLKYNIRQRIAATKTLKYNIRQRIANTLTLKYNIRQRIARTLTLKYNIRQQIARTFTLKYNIRQLVSRQYTLKYNIIGRIINTFTLNYNIRQRVTNTKTLKYNVRQRVTNTFTVLWNIDSELTRVANTFTLKYNIIQRVTQTSTLKYNIRQRVTQQKTLVYNIRKRVAASSTLIYNIRKRVTKTNTLIYNIVGPVRVTRTFRLIYNIIGAPVTATIPAAGPKIDWGRLAQNIVNLTTFHEKSEKIDVQDKLFERLKELKRLVRRIELENDRMQGASVQVQQVPRESPPATLIREVQKDHYITTRTIDKQKEKEIQLKSQLQKEIHVVKQQADTITKVMADNDAKIKSIVKSVYGKSEKKDTILNKINKLLRLEKIIDLSERDDNEADT